MESNVNSVTVNFPGNDTIWYRVDDESWSVHNGDSEENISVGIKDVS